MPSGSDRTGGGTGTFTSTWAAPPSPTSSAESFPATNLERSVTRSTREASEDVEVHPLEEDLRCVEPQSGFGEGTKDEVQGRTSEPLWHYESGASKANPGIQAGPE